jgi:glycosyltransferase involved in cell wall biosynthesis
LDVGFLKENLSQEWGLEVPQYCRFLDRSVLRSARALFADVRRSETVLVHLCGWGGDRRLPLLIAMARLRGVPVFVESDTQAPFNEAGARKVAKRLAYPMLFALPRMFFPGGSRQAAYLQGFGVPERRIRTVNMTVDVEAIATFADDFGQDRRDEWRSSLGLPRDATVFLFVGRLEAHKGISNLLDQFGHVAKEFPSARLLLVGDGSMRSDVKNIADACTWLRAPGRLKGNDLLSAYCSSDVLVLPSAFEPWGLVVNEAMAAGLPAVVSDRVGCGTDLVERSDTGVIYDYTKPDALGDALRRLLIDPGSRQRMGCNASRLISGWTLQAEAERICGAWSQAL